MDEDSEIQYGLVMPFVVTTDKGGPYDSPSLVAGMRLQEIWMRLEAGADSLQIYVEPPLLPQLDLVAMHFKYTMKSTPWEEYPEEWTLVEFTKMVNTNA